MTGHEGKITVVGIGADGMAVWMLGQEGLYPVAARLLRED